MQAGDETESAVRTWGGQHAALWAALAAAGAVEVVVVGRAPVRLAAAVVALLKVKFLDESTGLVDAVGGVVIWLRLRRRMRWWFRSC